jgi:hypothetical protein
MRGIARDVAGAFPVPHDPEFCRPVLTQGLASANGPGWRLVCASRGLPVRRSE